jgi:hypothetical protein
MYFVTLLLYLFLLVVWGIVGFFIWVPLLFRTSMAFAVSLLQCTLTGGEMNYAARALDHAKTFYFSGFRQLKDSVFHPTNPTTGTAMTTNVWRLFMEVVWAFVVWAVFLALFGILKNPF